MNNNQPGPSQGGGGGGVEYSYTLFCLTNFFGNIFLWLDSKEISWTEHEYMNMHPANKTNLSSYVIIIPHVFTYFFRNFEIIKKIAYEVILGLVYLNKRDMVHRSLSLENILLDDMVFLLCNHNNLNK